MHVKNVKLPRFCQVLHSTAAIAPRGAASRVLVPVTADEPSKFRPAATRPARNAGNCRWAGGSNLISSRTLEAPVSRTLQAHRCWELVGASARQDVVAPTCQACGTTDGGPTRRLPRRRDRRHLGGPIGAPPIGRAAGARTTLTADNAGGCWESSPAARRVYSATDCVIYHRR